MEQNIDNRKIGAMYATFTIMERETLEGKKPSLTEENVGYPVALSGSNEVSDGTYKSRLFGQLEHVSGLVATVQIAGIIRLPICDFSTILGCVPAETKLESLQPRIDKPVCLAVDGTVQRALVGHNRVIAINEDRTCDVLL